MNDLDINKTVILDSQNLNLISEKLAAVNNTVRFSILEILRDNQEKDPVNAEALYSRDINNILLHNYNINITPQMLGQHIKKLIEADLVKEVLVKKEIPNKTGKRTVKGYELKKEAFEELFLEISFMSDALFSFFNLYKSNQKYLDGENCVLTVFNGADKGKTLKVNKNQTALIGRKAEFRKKDLPSPSLLLDNSYETVSSVSKPHLKLFCKDDEWFIIDEASSNGTFIGDIEVAKGKPARLRANSFLKLSKGNGGAVIYCSFN